MLISSQSKVPLLLLNGFILMMQLLQCGCCCGVEAGTKTCHITQQYMGLSSSVLSTGVIKCVAAVVSHNHAALNTRFLSLAFPNQVAPLFTGFGLMFWEVHFPSLPFWVKPKNEGRKTPHKTLTKTHHLSSTRIELYLPLGRHGGSECVQGLPQFTLHSDAECRFPSAHLYSWLEFSFGISW